MLLLTPLTLKSLRPGGGDGTICSVASGLLGSDNQMGIIPAGTFNHFARSLNLPETVDEAVNVITNGKIRSTNISVINDSIGAYAAILQTREGIYDRWGRCLLVGGKSIGNYASTARNCKSH
jgi:diacylglycerol kinase family enzyme